MYKKKTAKNMRKPLPAVVSTEPATDAFEIELYWCVQQLENALNSGKLNQKLADDTAKNIKVLKGKSAPLVKKRQVMKAALGDYRTKMLEEEKTMSLASKQIKFTAPQTTDANKKCSFVKKSAILTSGKDFCFNFSPPSDDINNTTTQPILDTTNVNQPIAFTSGVGFKFNFAIADADEDFNLNDLSIK